MKKIYLLALVCVVNLTLISQVENGSYKEKFREGNFLILENNYELALASFKTAYLIDSSSANINYKLGLCYLESVSEKNKAEYHLNKAVKDISKNYSPESVTEKSAPPIAFKLLADAQRINYNFKGAEENLKKMKALVGTKNKELTDDIEKKISVNENAQEFLNNKANVTIVNLGDDINTNFQESNPVLSADESTFIFTSRRLGSTGAEKTDGGLFYEDIYISNKNNNGLWEPAKSIGKSINTNENDANGGLSSDGQRLFINKEVNGGDIYYSDLIGNEWTSPLPFGNNINTPDMETNGVLSADGNMFYFVSNRKIGSFGGKDIWVCEKTSSGMWGAAVNLGSKVNTSEDEDTPFIHADGVTLFFSSKGFKNMGGYDIFKTTKQADGKWSDAENLKPPINTPDDDLYYVQSADGKHGYLSSSRTESLGGKDLFRVDFNESLTKPVTLVSGVVTFYGDTISPTNAKITIKENGNENILQEIVPNSATGKYSVVFKQNESDKSYVFNYSAEGYKSDTSNVFIPKNSPYRNNEINIFLQKNILVIGTVSLSGNVKDNQNLSVTNVTITVKKSLQKKQNPGTTILSDSGAYNITLNKGLNYSIEYKAKGYLPHTEKLTVAKKTEKTIIQNNVILEKIKVASEVVSIDNGKNSKKSKKSATTKNKEAETTEGGLKTELSNILFDFNKSTFSADYTLKTDALVKFMKENPELQIEIIGHTDNKGSEDFNLKLSERRAKTVLKAITKKGISKKRLSARGVGELQPLVSNELSNGEPDENGMQLNRSVEFKIVH